MTMEQITMASYKNSNSSLAIKHYIQNLRTLTEIVTFKETHTIAIITKIKVAT